MKERIEGGYKERAAMKRFLLLAVAGVVVGAGSASATIIFQDDFNSGNLNNWSVANGNAFTIEQAPGAPAGDWSAYASARTDRMYHSLGVDVFGPSTFSFRMYDADGVGTGAGLGQVLTFSGPGGYGDGVVSAGAGIGEYPYTPVDPNYYQARIVGGASAGYYNMSIARTAGWHEFTIERRADNTTIDFYVDGILGATVYNARVLPWDSVALGLAVPGTAGSANIYFDDVFVEGVPVPEPSTCIAGALLLLPLGAGLIRKLRKA